ncbi:Permease of the major facilitator superfamily [Phaffia rhodozyma]|uniref:Permease of the major facilitator superfamily n=1 Tax=Phaffia rhodozyma TaxID=264483 RepID=A0A0F7SV03_PHARH|nr:Permease of the major facilitator superfamily [Phaffia rhodozyma]
MATPLPKKILFVLCLARLGEPIAYSVIFPFINSLVEGLSIVKDKSHVGFYAGLLEGAFSLSEILTIYFWGSLSDRIGRKPVIIIGLSGTAVSIVCFGLSTEFYQLALSRALNGALSGNVSVIKACLAEISDETNESRIMPMFNLMWSIGLVIGPLIGGYTSKPAEKFPTVFTSPFWKIYPYFLPCLIGSSIAFLSCLVTLFFLSETLQSKKRRDAEAILAAQIEQVPLLTPSPSTNHLPISPSSPIPNALTSNPPPETWTLKQILGTVSIRVVLLSYFFIVFLASSFDVLFVLFSYSAKKRGGLGLSDAKIAQLLMAGGVISAVSQLSIFPPLHRIFGTSRLYRACNGAFVLAFFIPLVLVVLPSSNTNGSLSGWEWGAVGMMVMVGRAAFLAFPLSMIALNIATPSPSALGSVNSINHILACISRGVGPALVGALFALSIKTSNPCRTGTWSGVKNGFSRVHYDDDDHREDHRPPALIVQASLPAPIPRSSTLPVSVPGTVEDSNSDGKGGSFQRSRRREEL